MLGRVLSNPLHGRVADDVRRARTSACVDRKAELLQPTARESELGGREKRLKAWSQNDRFDGEFEVVELPPTDAVSECRLEIAFEL